MFFKGIVYPLIHKSGLVSKQGKSMGADVVWLPTFLKISLFVFCRRSDEGG